MKSSEVALKHALDDANAEVARLTQQVRNLEAQALQDRQTIHFLRRETIHFLRREIECLESELQGYYEEEMRAG